MYYYISFCFMHFDYLYISYPILSLYITILILNASQTLYNWSTWFVMWNVIVTRYTAYCLQYVIFRPINRTYAQANFADLLQWYETVTLAGGLLPLHADLDTVRTAAHTSGGGTALIFLSCVRAALGPQAVKLSVWIIQLWCRWKHMWQRKAIYYVLSEGVTWMFFDAGQQWDWDQATKASQLLKQVWQHRVWNRRIACSLFQRFQTFWCRDKCLSKDKGIQVGWKVSSENPAYRETSHDAYVRQAEYFMFNNSPCYTWIYVYFHFQFLRAFPLASNSQYSFLIWLWNPLQVYLCQNKIIRGRAVVSPSGND